MRHRTGTEQLAKAVLLVLTVVLMASMGGGFLALPLLIPAHRWAAQRSPTSVGRVAWSFLPAVAIGMVAWAAVYVVVGETKPMIWLVPFLAWAVALVLLAHTATASPEHR